MNGGRYADAHKAAFPTLSIKFMGLIDGFTEAMFLRDDDGRAVLRPFGRFGAAVVVSAEQETVLKRRLTWFWGVYFLILMATVLLGGLGGLLALLVIATAAHSLLIWGFIRRLPRTDQVPPINRRAALQRTSVATGRPLLWATLIGSLLFVVAGTWLITLGQRSVGWISVVFFGLATISSAVQLRAAYRGSSKAPRN